MLTQTDRSQSARSLPAPVPDLSNRLGVEQTSWVNADGELWLLNFCGAFGGMIDRHGGHFFAMDAFGRYIGDFTSLRTAQEQLVRRVARDRAAA